MSVSTLSPDRRLARLKDRTRRRQAVLATFVVAGSPSCSPVGAWPSDGIRLRAPP